MAGVEYEITLGIEKFDRSPEMVSARVGDYKSVSVKANITRNGEAYTPQGQNAFFECITNAGTSVRVPATKSGSTVSVNIPSQALVKPGVITCAYFRFEDGDSADPTMVESTQSFCIVVPNSIDDEVIAEDYIAEWRELQATLVGYVEQVQQEATQAKADIGTQVDSVESSATSAKGSISSEVSGVDTAANEAIAAINDEKQAVQNAASDVTAAGNQAISKFEEDAAAKISQFQTNSQSEIETFDTNSQQAISTFNTNGTAAINAIETDKDEMLEDAQQDVNTQIAALQKATQEAVDAMEAALSEDQYGELLQRLSRVWKLDTQDMTAVAESTDLNTLRTVGTYICNQDTTVTTLVNKPEKLASAFYMFVLKMQSNDRYFTQLIIPYKPAPGDTTVKFWLRTSEDASTWAEWSQVGSSVQVTAGKGIVVSGDGDEKEVSIDTDAFYEHVGPTDIATVDTSVTGGGRIKQLKVFGQTRQNLWVNPDTATIDGVTCTSNPDGSITLSGTATDRVSFGVSMNRYNLKPGATYTLSVDKAMASDWVMASTGGSFSVNGKKLSVPDSQLFNYGVGYGSTLTSTFTVPSDDFAYVWFLVFIENGTEVSGTYRVMLNEGSEAQPWCPPGLNSVESLEIVTAGKNLLPADANAYTTSTNTSVSIDGDTVTVSSTRGSYKFCQVNIDFLAGHIVHFGRDDAVGGYPVMQLVYSIDGVYEFATHIESPHTIPSTATNISIRLYCNNSNNAGAWSTTFTKPYLRIDDVAEYAQLCGFVETTIDLDGNQLCSLPDGTRDELVVDAGGKVVLRKKTDVFAATTSTEWTAYDDECKHAAIPSAHGISNELSSMNEEEFMCDAYPTVGKNWNSVNWTSYPSVAFSASAAFVDKVMYCKGSGPEPDSKAFNVLYLRKEDQTIPLGTIQLPELPAPNVNVWASAEVPAEVELDVVKVDYLSSSNDDSVNPGGFEPAFDILPVSKGGTGVSSAQAERNRLGLGNTTGAVPVANGGTGSTTAKSAQYALLNGMNEVPDIATDNTLVVTKYTKPGTDVGAVCFRKLSCFTDWVASKVRSTFGFGSSNVLSVTNGGTGATTAAAAREALGAGTSNFSGSYNDLEDKPTIPSVSYPISIANGGTGASTAEQARANIGAAATEHDHAIADVSGLQSALDGKAAVSHSHTLASLVGSTTSEMETAREALGIYSGYVDVQGAGEWETFTAQITASGFNPLQCMLQVCAIMPGATDPGQAPTSVGAFNVTSSGFMVGGYCGEVAGAIRIMWLAIKTA